jgi:peptidoglycan pentaglycine glycine transferase (the first glycine)
MEQVKDPNGWNQEVLRKSGGFLQSWQWGEFQKAAGSEVIRLRDAAGAMGQFVSRRLPLGKRYWYCPRGPLGEAAGLLNAKDFSGSAFVRIEPVENPKAQKLTPDAFLRRLKKTASVQPAQTMIVDLRKDAGDLLAAMHEKTRYNIRLAERKGVKVYGATIDDFEAFWELMSETAKRDGFHEHSGAHYRKMLETLAGDPAVQSDAAPKARLVFAEHDGRVLAANLMIYFGDTATYLHGASSSVRREVMAPHLLHWRCMLEAKSWGYAGYDFWGVAPPDEPDHAWAGITRFKKGFGGSYVAYPGAFDLPIDRFWYTLYSLAQRLRGRSHS